MKVEGRTFGKRKGTREGREDREGKEDVCEYDQSTLRENVTTKPTGLND
jgi:hypothetical protein